MPWQAWFTLATVLCMIVALAREWARVDVTILSALSILLIAGVLRPVEAFSGVAWETVITIASLYVVAAGIHQTGILTWIDRWLAQPDRSVTSLLFRIMAPTAVLSACLNNTPVVAMLIPRMQAIARKTGVPVSKLLMPLSFAAIAGGMITLVGTSTNIIASGIIREAGMPEFGLFEFAWIGLPAAALAVLYLSLAGHRLMPDATPGDQETQKREEKPPLFQAVVSTNSMLAGKTLKEVNFREKYEGVVLAIHRRNESIRGSIGNVPLKPGDLLVIDANKEFDLRWRQGQEDFYLVAKEIRRPQRITRKTVALLAMLSIWIVLHIAGLLPLAAAAFAGALGTVLMGFLRGPALRQSVDITVVLTITGALGIGHAVQESGLATGLGHAIATILPGQHPLVALLFLYLGAMIVTEIITNSAAVVIMIPVALATAIDVGLEPRAVAMAVTIASSASFLSPLGYQTNLMVMGAGGYRFRDYFRAGLPVSIGVMAIALAAVYMKWL